MRKRLSYANVMATLAFFFALTGGAVAGVKYITAADPIPPTSDLGGSTYGNPLIAAGKVTTSKIADGAITSAKFDSGATAPNANAVGGLNVTPMTDSFSNLNVFSHDLTLTCPGDRIAFNPRVTSISGTQLVSIQRAFVPLTQDTGFLDYQSYVFRVSVDTVPNSVSIAVSCFGSSQ